MKKPTKVCVNNAGALFTFIPVEVVEKLKLKAGDRLSWKLNKSIAKLQRVKPETERSQA